MHICISADMFYILIIVLIWIYGTQIKYQYQYQCNIIVFGYFVPSHSDTNAFLSFSCLGFAVVFVS